MTTRRVRQPKPLRRAVEIGSVVYLRRPMESDRVEFTALRKRNRRHLERWEPIPRGVNAFTDTALDQAFDRELKLRRTITDERFLICLVESGQIAGKISISGISRGPLQECRLGYWLAKTDTGKGCMTEAVALATRYSFLTLGLHRVEANMQPHNHASRGVVRNNGFHQEGYSLRYLCIRGRWVDHERWAITLESWLARSSTKKVPTPSRRASRTS